MRSNGMLTCESVALLIEGRQLFNLSLSLFPGAIVVVNGPNGSGKTSLLKVLAGLMHPNSGRILWNQTNIDEVPRPYANYIGHAFGVKDELTVIENLKLWSVLYHSEHMFEAAIHYFGLGAILDDKVHTLSAGIRKKIALARLLTCNSDLWLLDEVENTLDENNRALLYNAMVTKANSGGIIIMASHNESPFKNAIQLNIEDFNA